MLAGLVLRDSVPVIALGTAAVGGVNVLLSPDSCDPLYRRSVRVSIGQVLTVPWTRLSSLSFDLSVYDIFGTFAAGGAHFVLE